jgi:hypothetical protein
MCALIQHHLFLWYHVAIKYPFLPVVYSWLKFINLKSYFVLGQIIVVVKPMLPVGDISLLFGIDLTGDKAIMDPIISEQISYA